MDRRLELIGEMTPAIWVHLLALLPAVILGAVVLYRRKGDAHHKLLGRIWIALMTVAAVSSFWIIEIREGFSPIHALSVWTLLSMGSAVAVLRVGGKTPVTIGWHRGFLQSLYASGILIAGGFTFMPNRLLGRLTFGETLPALNWLFVTACMLGGIWMLIAMRRTRRRDVEQARGSAPVGDAEGRSA